MVDNITSGIPQSELSKSALSKLKLYYVIAVSIILFTIVLSQLFIFNHLQKQIKDSRVINIAGRQRMLSQKITKEIFKLNFSTNSLEEKSRLKAEILKNLATWRDSHFALKNRSSEFEIEGQNSTAIDQQFAEIQPIFDKLYKAALLSVNEEDPQDLDQIYALSDEFLKKMDDIVFTYDKDASNRVTTLKKLELLFLFLSILVLALEVIFIFTPAANYARKIIDQLINAENEALGLAKQNQKLFNNLEASTEELRAMNYALDQTTMFASLDNTGKIKYLSEKFKNLLKLKDGATGSKIQQFLAKTPIEKDKLDNVFRNMKSSVWNDELEVNTDDGSTHYLDIRVVPVYRFGMRYELFLICTDITKRVLATTELNKLIKDRYENKIKEQKIRSSQILNAQEEERKRIARDMHDGIGQMLTALKFNIEALDTSASDVNSKQLIEINKLAKSIINEVRTTTFNLTPPELSDYGIAAGIKKMASQLQNLTGKTIQVSSNLEGEMRFDPFVEINLYRIVQEAVNNALKYSKGSIILIKINKSDDIFSISIIDDGAGFDPDQLIDSKNSGGGKGLVNMKERASMINGRLFISSERGTGSKITINLPLTNS